MSSLLVHPQASGTDGRVLVITPQSAGWAYTGLEVYHLTEGATLGRETGAREVCLVLVTGAADITAGGRTFDAIGGRGSPFEADAAPAAVYVPRDSAWSLKAHGDVELAVCSAPGGGQHAVRLIKPQDMGRETRGTGTNSRHIRNILPDSDQTAHSLLVVEVITPPGHWSSYPPHKHDTDDPPNETRLEEIYYHRLNPPQGFAFQRVYTDDGALDDTMTVYNGDAVLVPRGYHPAGAPHGYALYYLNVMAGPRRKWIFRNDPAHAWIVES